MLAAAGNDRTARCGTIEHRWKYVGRWQNTSYVAKPRRIHSETVIEPYPIDRASLERDCEVEFFIASGPGGQRRNKVETGVRLIHRPSGITVTATERRSQRANLEVAFERMAARLQDMQRISKPRRPTRPTTASRVRRLEAKRRASLLKRQRSASPGNKDV